MEIAKCVWVGERERDQMGPEGRGVVCYVVACWVGCQESDGRCYVVVVPNVKFRDLREIKVVSAIYLSNVFSRVRNHHAPASSSSPPHRHRQPLPQPSPKCQKQPPTSNRNDPLRTGTHQNPPTPQTPLDKIPGIAPTREQPQFVKTGESGFVLFLRLSCICIRSSY